jgi:hypothetical protein
MSTQTPKPAPEQVEEPKKVQEPELKEEPKLTPEASVEKDYPSDKYDVKKVGETSDFIEYSIKSKEGANQVTALYPKN